MKQRGRSPASKPNWLADPSTSLSRTGASSKSLTAELMQDNHLDEVTKEESSLSVPTTRHCRSQSQTLSPCHSRTSSRPEFNLDLELDSTTDDQDVHTHKAIEQIQQKIVRTKELIREEQTSRDNNVNEYLKLSTNAEKQQQNRIKQVFEKKNQKSAQSILQLQKKLEEYHRRVRDLEERGLHRPSQKIRGLGQGIKNVGENIRDGISGMSSTVMSKPKELAAQLLKNRSFENLPDSSEETEKSKTQKEDEISAAQDEKVPRERCFSYDGTAHQAVFIGLSGLESESDESVPTNVVTAVPSSQQLAVAPPANSPRHADPEWKAVIQELTLLKEEVGRLTEDISDVKQHFKQELESVKYQLQDQREHCERLEDQIRDMIELHQHEILSIRNGVTDMEEKVQYQSEERVLDIREHLQSLENKLTAVEHQAAQQQYLNIEGIDTSDARALLMKLLTAVITVVHIFLFFAGTLCSIVRPFVSSGKRVAVTVVIISISVAVYHKQDDLEIFITKLRNKEEEKS